MWDHRWLRAMNFLFGHKMKIWKKKIKDKRIIFPIFSFGPWSEKCGVCQFYSCSIGLLAIGYWLINDYYKQSKWDNSLDQCFCMQLWFGICLLFSIIKQRSSHALTLRSFIFSVKFNFLPNEAIRVYNIFVISDVIKD